MKKNNGNNNFKLTQEDFFPKEVSNTLFPKRKPLPYEKIELFQNDYFKDGQIDADIFYQEQKYVPYAIFVFYLPTDYNPNNEKIKRIYIRTLKSDIYKNKSTEKDDKKKREINTKFRLYELFTPRYWNTIGIDMLFAEFLPERHFNNLRSREEYGLREVFDFSWELLENIWNDYCLKEGKTSIERKTFSLWLYRLNSLVYDLYRYPLINADEHQWQFRYLFIRKLLKSKMSHYYEYYLEDNWNKILNDIFTKEMATEVRILDAKDLLNDFFKQMNPISALERLIIDFYLSFAEKLIKDNKLIKCKFCNEFIAFKKGKKYCSLLTENKDCGKKARNKRYYEKRGKERLDIYREKTRALREFYKEKGIKK